MRGEASSSPIYTFESTNKAEDVQTRERAADGVKAGNTITVGERERESERRARKDAADVKRAFSIRIIFAQHFIVETSSQTICCFVRFLLAQFFSSCVIFELKFRSIVINFATMESLQLTMKHRLIGSLSSTAPRRSRRRERRPRLSAAFPAAFRHRRTRTPPTVRASALHKYLPSNMRSLTSKLANGGGVRCE